MDLGRAATRAARVRAGRQALAAIVDRQAWTLRVFIWLVFAGGVGSLLIPAAWNTSPDSWLPAFGVLTVVAVALEFRSVPLPNGGSISVATIAHIATILLVPAPYAAISVGVSVVVEELVRRATLPKLAFNVGGMLLTASLCSYALGFSGDVWGIRSSTMSQVYLLLPFVVVGLTYHAVNLVLTSAVFAIVSGRPFPSVVRANTRGTLLSDGGAASIGALAALIWTVEPVLAALLALPGAVIGRSFEHNRRLEIETGSAVRSLADTIDDRDTTTFHHSERVAALALVLGKQLKLDEDELQLIEQAAAVHDLGKIGVPDRILLKRGPLSSAEMTTMRLHTEIGARVLSQFSLFRQGAAIVRHHHEQFDGSGYPDGLAGEAIPHGARVIAVADAFDAMTSDRPYRSALSSEEAVRRLQEGRGRQWDPVVVDAFLSLYATGAIDHLREHDAVDTHPHGHGTNPG
jgi:HD-GYP domain-containing protein (c-di-GMP phosphodiesterase class II)